MSDSSGRSRRLRAGSAAAAAGASGGATVDPAARAVSRSTTFISPGPCGFARQEAAAPRQCPAGRRVAIGPRGADRGLAGRATLDSPRSGPPDRRFQAYVSIGDLDALVSAGGVRYRAAAFPETCG